MALRCPSLQSGHSSPAPTKVHHFKPPSAAHWRWTHPPPHAAGLTGIDPTWLAEVSAPLCTFSEPLAEPAPFYKAYTDQVGVGMGIRVWVGSSGRWDGPEGAPAALSAAECCSRRDKLLTAALFGSLNPSH